MSGQKSVTLAVELHPGRACSFATDCLDRMLSRGDCLASLAQEGDLKFAVSGNEEFCVRMNFIKYLTSIRARHRGMVVVLVMVMMLMIMMLMVIWCCDEWLQQDSNAYASQASGEGFIS